MGVAHAVGWALWGGGLVSHQAAQDLRSVPGARIVAVGSRRLDAARQFAAVHPGATALDSLSQLISHAGVDAVYIATPDGCHREDALAAMAAGKAVLCEKPLATSLADVQSLVDAADRHQVFLMEAMWMRLLPAIVALRRVVEAGEIGEIRYMQGSFGYADARRGHEPYPSLAHSMLYDRGIYLVALAHMLQATDATNSSASCLQWTQGGTARALCRFELQWTGGPLLEGVCSNAGELANTFEVIGTRGTISIPGPFFKAHSFNVQLLPERDAVRASISRRDSSAASALAQLKRLKRRLQPLPAALRALRPSPWNFAGNGYQFQFAEVARCLAAGRLQSEFMTWNDSLALARALDQIRRASEEPTA